LNPSERRKIYLVTLEEFCQVIDENPEITTNGFGVAPSENGSPDERMAAFVCERDALQSKYQEFLSCVQWLQENPVIERNRYAYSLKQDVERWVEGSGQKHTWIPEGVFTLAAIFMGYTIRRIPHSTGARFSEFPEHSLAQAS